MCVKAISFKHAFRALEQAYDIVGIILEFN